MNILVIEDHALVREGLRHLLRALDSATTVWEADGAGAALLALGERGDDLDLVVLDLGLPGAKPFDVLMACRRLLPQVPVAVLSATEDRFEIERALGLGVQAYLFKSSSNREILASLRRVLKGEIVVPGGAPGPSRRRVPHGPRSPDALTSDAMAPPAGLTERQATVLRLLARGVSNKEIAEALGLTENTVKVHLAHVYRILGVTTRTAAVQKAERVGLLENG